MRCPGCGEINQAGYTFCRNCGHALSSAEANAPTEAMPVPSPVHPPASSTPPPTPAPTEAPPIFRMVADSGLLSGRNFTVGRKGLLVGRDPVQCQVIIPDDEVSRLHAWIGYDKSGQLILEDRHSANGTYVNGKRIERQLIQLRDQLSFGSGGRHVFRIETAEAPAVVPEKHVPTSRVPAVPGGGTSVLSRADLGAVQPEQEAAGGTVKLKLTDLMARPHVDLIVDKYAVKSVDIPDSGLTVGRDHGRCAIVLDHPSVSGVHVEVQIRDGHIVVTDRSTNGTFVNGLRVSTAELHDGDYITFGRYAGKSLIYRTGLEPELKVEKVDLTKDRLSIGRDPANDIRINHPTVSMKHAEVVRQNGKFVITDLGSTNGTFVNGIKIKRHPLQELDRIVIGPTELHFSGASLARTSDATVVRLDVRSTSFEVPDRNTGKPRRLLDDISLVVKPRELIGLLGPSGAGKTTLMNVLNGFQKPSSGDVLYNGLELYRNLARLKSTIGYVPQEDIVHKQLSVRRCLYYAAKLRLPEDVPEEEVQRRVEEMLDILKVDPQRWDNPVGTLSGGQRKRISIGIELLPKPGVLFLDEPTAGLDPRTETLMMMLFRQLANQGSTIIITTHLLASFGVLDKVVVLVQGRLAFYGPGTKFLDYFKAEAPPDVYDDLTDNNTVSYAQELKRRFQASPLYREMVTEPLATAEAQRPAAPPAAPAVSEGRRFSLHQFKVLLRRNWELKFGDRAQTLLLFLQAPLVALLVALMAGEANQIQTLFMAMFAALWFGCSNAVREIVDEQTIYRRERQTGIKIPSYIFSKLAVLTFVCLVQCASVIVVLLLVNHALSLSPDEIIAAVVILELVAINGTLIGLVISALVRTPEKALALFPLVLIPELLLSGLFLPVRRIQPVIPITVEQLFEGKLFAQPEAKAKAKTMMPPAAPTPGETKARAEVAQGEVGHQVVGAMAPSAQVEQTFHKYTPEPVEGMPTVVRWLSVLAVSRWGLEALADLGVHGQRSMQDSAYKIINTVYISFHPQDLVKLEQGLEAPASAFAAQGGFPLPSHLWRDKAPYFAVLLLGVILMTVILLVLMKRKDIA